MTVLRKIFLMWHCWSFWLYSLRNVMAQEWLKTLRYSVLQFDWIKKVLKSSLLWQALTFKRFELQIWDWSWLKFKNLWNHFKKSSKIFFYVFYEQIKRYSFWAAASKGPMTNAFTHMGNIFFFRLPFLLLFLLIGQRRRFYIQKMSSRLGNQGEFIAGRHMNKIY